MNNKKCASCGLVNFAADDVCRRCGAILGKSNADSYEFEERAEGKPGFLKRALVTLGVVALLLLIAYVSLLLTSSSISYERKQIVERAISLIEAKRFDRNAFVLRHLVSYRATDNWWNKWVGHADAYAATNFPFQVVTLYPDFLSFRLTTRSAPPCCCTNRFTFWGRARKKLLKRCGETSVRSAGRGRSMRAPLCGETCAG